MAKGYWILRIDVTDQERFMAYLGATPVALKKYGARFLARAGRFEAPEGTARARNTIIEFPTYEAALACWHSPEYQAARALRLGAAELELLITEGYEGVQPS
jgi:uncharacterized protein (DUF1330 family)